MTAHDVYVYGVVRSGHTLLPGHRGVGLPPSRLRLLRGDGTSAVVSEAPEGLRARRRDLLAHQDLLLTMSESGPVLPMRFGMVAPDEDTVLAQLASSRAAYLAALDRLEGRLELNVKALPVQEAVASLLREDARLRRLRQEVRLRPGYEANIRLGEAVATGLARRAAAAAETALQEFTALAEECVRGPEVPGCVLNASFLVARADVDRFRNAVGRYAAEHRDRVELRLTGPLPCYSFVAANAVRAGV
ncbi:GvpL/GvpF family gas vesicle protein [Streptomyces sp. NA04227]|uniref:GvpL/GvpF family gas vesicle protein n=1 Tax=Streptomyces sp. NA04227 TaxID=2742136 RepID=UPI0015915E4B|nr:GvpL/GvpF family gas vesicle protein [Streptomyces sp. NA04227]QKW09988.1 GvpL/GvpF family gas vesicle protein [Streptomyces sp. NA04227]